MAYQRSKDIAWTRNEMTKRAIALAMRNRWSEAVDANRSLLEDFPYDVEAYNRLGRALTELGRLEEAKGAFRQVLAVSPHNAIARKNLDRLAQLGNDLRRTRRASRPAARTFIGDTGKTGVTSLVNLPPPNVLAKVAPGDDVRLELDNRRLNVIGGAANEKLGQVEPKIASRIKRLIDGGNQYEATVKSVDDHEITIIIREVYKHPSQSDIVSFPSHAMAGARLSGASDGYEFGPDESAADTQHMSDVKDWSDDDTEPGDDDIFSSSVHRIISSDGEES